MFSSPAQRAFRDTLTWRIAAALPFFPLLAWGIYDFSQNHTLNPVLWFFAGLSGALFAYACLWAARRKITIHAEGICYKSLVTETDIRWDEVTETRYGQSPVNVGAHFGLLGLLIAALARSNDKLIRTFQIFGARKIAFGSNIRGVQQAIQLVLAAVNPRLRRDLERTLSSGGTVAFGKISLSPEGVIWKSKAPIPFGAIATCGIDGGMLRIKAEGKWLDNIAISPIKVPNIFILLDMIEERRSALGRGIKPPAVAGAAGQYL